MHARLSLRLGSRCLKPKAFAKLQQFQFATKSSGKHESDGEKKLTKEQLKAKKEEEKQKMIEKVSKMSDGQIFDLVSNGEIAQHTLEEYLDTKRAVKIRRMYMASLVNKESLFEKIPHEHYDYNPVKGKCCENVVGYMPVPLGIIGPYIIDGKEYLVPMATTEGALLASTNRGVKAINLSGGATTVILGDGMTRGPAIEMPSASKAVQLAKWIEEPENYEEIRKVFNSTSRFAKLQEIKPAFAGKHVFLRFKCTTGDAMGMNMISIATNAALTYLMDIFPEMKIEAVSGNLCTDKKPSSINWLEGRGKHVVCDAVIKKEVVAKVLKTNVDTLVKTNTVKNLVGSSLAGSIGGFNAHAANIVTAIFIACGQDPAQNVESSNCVTFFEKNSDGDLYISVTMPSIEVGTVGGGTNLPPQSGCLDILGVRGSHPERPGDNAKQLARVVAATTLAGELNLLAALATNELVSGHLTFGRGVKTSAPSPMAAAASNIQVDEKAAKATDL